MGNVCGRGSSPQTQCLKQALLAGDAVVSGQALAAAPKIARQELCHVTGDLVWHLVARSGEDTLLTALLQALKTCVSFILYTQYHLNPMTFAHSAPHDQQQLSNLLDIQNRRGQTALMLACGAGFAHVVKVLLQHGADAWVCDKRGGRNCMHYAAASGNPDTMDAVLQEVHDQNPTPCDRIYALYDNPTVEGFTPLMFACYHDQQQNVLKLLEVGADVYMKTTTLGHTFMAAMREIADPVALARHAQNSSDSDSALPAVGSTALHVAAFAGSRRAVWSILKTHANIMALEMEPMPRDPRTVLDGASHLPYCVAFKAQHHRALAMLHPHVILQSLFAQDPREGIRGPMKLKQLAAGALQVLLLQQISNVTKGCQDQQAVHEFHLDDSPSPSTHYSSDSHEGRSESQHALHITLVEARTLDLLAAHGLSHIPSIGADLADLRQLSQSQHPAMQSPDCADDDGLESVTCQSDSQEESDSNEVQMDRCCVCLDMGQFVAIVTCSHRLCVTCAKELVSMQPFKTSKCPLCRQQINGFRACEEAFQIPEHASGPPCTVAV